MNDEKNSNKKIATREDLYELFDKKLEQQRMDIRFMASLFTIVAVFSRAAFYFLIGNTADNAARNAEKQIEQKQRDLLKQVDDRMKTAAKEAIDKASSEIRVVVKKERNR